MPPTARPSRSNLASPPPRTPSPPPPMVLRPPERRGLHPVTAVWGVVLVLVTYAWPLPGLALTGLSVLGGLGWWLRQRLGRRRGRRADRRSSRPPRPAPR